MELRLLISWPKEREVVLDYLGEPSIITRVLKMAETDRRSQCQSDMMWQMWLAISCFVDVRGPQIKGCGWPQESGRDKEIVCSWEPPEGTPPGWHSRPPEQWDNTFSLLQATYFVLIYYSSNRKLIHHIRGRARTGNTIWSLSLFHYAKWPLNCLVYKNRARKNLSDFLSCFRSLPFPHFLLCSVYVLPPSFSPFP